MAEITMQFMVPPPAPAASRWTSRIAVFSLVLIVTAFLLHRLLGLPTLIAFNLVKVAYAGVALSLFLSAVASVGIWRFGDPGTARVVFSTILCLLMLAGPAIALVLARDYPLLNDVTTDTVDPPSFDVLTRVRGPGSNPAAYPGAVFATEQRSAYPDLRPMRLDRSAEETFELVTDALKRMKIEVVRSDAPDSDAGRKGMIEAIDRTLILGFYDDLAIRVSPEGDKAARIDIRSASRYGWTDYGRNAERVRALMREIVTRLESTVPTVDSDRLQRSKKPGRELMKRGKKGDPKQEDLGRSRARPR